MRDRPAGVPASLEVWIEGLRDRLDRGGLAHLGPIELRDGCRFPSVELGARIMLADVELFRAMNPAERELPHCRARRVYLAAKLRRLRERLG